MPYITKDDRPRYDKTLDELIKTLKERPVENVDGDINYCVTRILKGVYPLRYFHLNRAMGVLSCIQQEFYRRVAAPYEDTKIEQNGDV
jgi:hypothetical protein